MSNVWVTHYLSAWQLCFRPKTPKKNKQQNQKPRHRKKPTSSPEADPWALPQALPRLLQPRPTPFCSSKATRGGSTPPPAQTQARPRSPAARSHPHSSDVVPGSPEPLRVPTPAPQSRSASRRRLRPLLHPRGWWICPYKYIARGPFQHPVLAALGGAALNPRRPAGPRAAPASS